MKNKKKLAFLTLAMTMGMVLGACNPAPASSNSNTSSGPAETSTSSSSSSESTSSSSSSSSSVVATLVSISVTAPTKVAYTTADTALDLAGMVVTATYSDGSTKAIATGYTVSTVDFSTTGEKTVTVTYEGKTATFKITVAAILVSITVTPPTKLVYTTADTALDLAGMVVKANYSDNSQKTITEGYTVSTVDFTSIGEKTVTVTYQGKTDSFKVTVNNQKFTVKFVVNGVEVKSYEVENGQTAAYDGDTPTKAGDANAVKYRFKGWDKDLTQPITQDTTFTAVFAEYAAEQVVDNFESYESNSDMADAWKVEAYKNDAWGDTSASVSIGSKATQGNKALRFDGWENGIGFRFTKHLAENALPKSANAIKFNMQIPSMNTVKVILRGKATIGGQQQEPSFTYEFKPTTNEYVEYTIPVAADEWQLWNQAGQSIKAVAGYTGIHEDDLTNYLTDVGFFVQGNDGANGLPYFAFVDNVRFVTLDEPVAKDAVETMGQYTTYTGLLNNGCTVKVELGANGSATAIVLDAPEQQQIPGNVTIDANKNMTFTSANNGATLVYKAQLKNGGQSMKFVEASGAFAEAVTGVDLNAVQVVDNYDQYTSDGQAYCIKYPDASQRSGCRGAYYSEYYSNKSTDSTEWGGAKWSLLGSDGSQLKLKTDGGHSGNNYLCMKNSQYNAMRYMQWGLYDGTSEQNNFRGSKLSFWAKTNGLVKAFKVAMYYQTKPRNATQNNYVSQQTFTQTEAIGQWTHFEVDLNPANTYYGFLVFMDHNDTADSFLYIDDVEVYTANPYATYVPPEPPVTYGALKNGQVFFANIAGYAGSTLTVKKNNAVTLDFPMMDTTIEGTYTQENDQISFDFGAYGTYVANINADSNKLEYVSATGVIQTFGEFTFNEMDVLDNAESYTESGKMYYQSNKDVNNRSGARGAYYCDYYGGGSSSTVGGTGWDLMGGSGDQLSLETSIAHSGSNSLKMKRNKTNAMRYMTWGLFDGSAEGHTGANYFSYWVKNPNSVALTVKTSVYYQATVTAGTQQSNRAYVEAQIPANSDWTQVVIPLDPAKTYYGVAYVPATVSGGGSADYFYVDDAMFYSEEMNIAAPFLAVKGLEMSGALANGAAASITLGEQGKCTLTCAQLGGSLNATFTLIGDKMTITVPAFMGGEKTVITGTYAPTDTGGVVGFTVISTTGEMAAYLPADTFFSGSIA